MKKLMLIIIFLFLMATPVFAEDTVETRTIEVNSVDSFYSAIINCVMQNEERIIIKSKEDLAPYINYTELSIRAIAYNEYQGNNLFGIRYEVETIGDYNYYTFYFSLYSNAWENSEITKRAAAMALDMEGLTDYQKIRAVHDYLVLQGEYVIFGQGAYAAMFQGMTACNGYALAFKRVMDEVGIPCRVNTGDQHMWNTVYLEGYWYNIDVTWDDLGGKAIGYSYFLKSNDDWVEHASANSDAPSSYPAQSFEFKFPPYNLYNMGIKALLMLFAVFIALIIYSSVRYRKRKVISYVDIPEWEFRNYDIDEDEEY